MKDLLSEYSKAYQYDPPSFGTFVTCILSPKYCAFNVPGNVPELRDWVPRPNFVNRAETFENLKKAIRQMNKKFDSRAGTAQVWRETEVQRKLHFTADIKLRIMTSIQKIFTNNAKV